MIRSPLEVAAIWSEALAASAREDEQFDKYLRLEERPPRPVEMWSDIEGSTPRPTEVVDMDHWANWFEANP